MLGQTYEPTIHTLCLRIPIEHILTGRFWAMGLVSVVGTLLLLVVAFFCGPLFCGKCCPAGALPEYLAKLVPRRGQIEWGRYLPLTALRYGFLLGFMLSPLVGSVLACSYCNFFVLDLFINYVFWGYAVAFSSSLLLTFILWFFVFGIFTKGGRGFCNFFCPVGALQNFCHYLGDHFGLANKLMIDGDKCVGCGKCTKVCPMEAVKITNGQAECSIHHCILCFECEEICPTQAISYGKESKVKTHAPKS
ncbi:MAG: 4Fe-4S binding protein [Acidaminococcaceae bacterium]